MKFVFTSILITVIQFSLYAQTAATEAKAAYLLAEEAFSANDWKNAIAYLEDCKKKIGTPNSKILYLQIMTEMELAKTDSSYNASVLKTIADFEKAPDLKSFNEDKVLDVMKIKIRITRLQEQAEKDQLAKEERARLLKTLGGTIVTEKEGHGLVMGNQDLGKMDFNKAIKACEDLVLNGHDDWRLPTLEEFNQMSNLNSEWIIHKSQPSGFMLLGGIYWVSDVMKNVKSPKKLAAQAYLVRPVRNF